MNFERCKIDKDGYIIDIVLSDEVGMDLIEMAVPQGIHKPKWNGSTWAEGLSEEELSEIVRINLERENQLSELDKLRIAQAEQFEYLLEIIGGM